MFRASSSKNQTLSKFSIMESKTFLLAFAMSPPLSEPTQWTSFAMIPKSTSHWAIAEDAESPLAVRMKTEWPSAKTSLAKSISFEGLPLRIRLDLSKSEKSKLSPFLSFAELNSWGVKLAITWLLHGLRTWTLASVNARVSSKSKTKALVLFLIILIQ